MEDIEEPFRIRFNWGHTRTILSPCQRSRSSLSVLVILENARDFNQILLLSLSVHFIIDFATGLSNYQVLLLRIQYLLVQCVQCNCVVFTDRQFSVPVITRISWNIHGMRSCGYFLLVFLFDSWICMIKYVWSLSEWRVIHKQRKQQQHPNPIPLVVLVSVLASLCLVNDQWVG